MNRHYLVMKWDYTYDKEGTWFDDDAGEYAYELLANTHFTLPHIQNKRVEILSVEQEGERICVQLGAEHQTVTVCTDGEPVPVHVSDSYMVCGDSVHQSLRLVFSVERKDAFETRTENEDE